MANPIDKLECSIRSDNARVLTWTMSSGITLPENARMVMENSRTGGTWSVVADNLQAVCAWIDTRKRNYNKRMHECYRLRLDAGNGEEYVSNIVDAGNHLSYPFSADAENIIKQVSTEISNSGCTGKLLKRKTWGRKCSKCVDFAGQASVNEHCDECLGTGISGGYFPGISLGIIKDSIATQEAVSMAGSMQAEKVQGRCIAYPWICAGDVWAEDHTNKRYMIQAVTPAASYKCATLVYTIVMNRIEYADILHGDEANELVDRVGAWDGNDDTEPSWDSILGASL